MKPIEELRAKSFTAKITPAASIVSDHIDVVLLSDAEEIIKRQGEWITKKELENILVEFAGFLEEHGADNLTSGVEPYAEYFAKQITGE